MEHLKEEYDFKKKTELRKWKQYQSQEVSNKQYMQKHQPGMVHLFNLETYIYDKSCY